LGFAKYCVLINEFIGVVNVNGKSNIDSNKALLVIDIQEDATGKTASKPYKNSKELIDNANLVISASEKAGIAVIYI
jgi:hypothetical protein